MRLLLALISSSLLLTPTLGFSGESKDYFADFYSEALWISRVQTLAGDGALRFGKKVPAQKIEYYGLIRASGDSRTQQQGYTQVYNDNTVFAGAGLDYVYFIPGLRLTAQAGYSWDLSDKVHRAGFDYRTGLLTYHEIHWADSKVFHEIYSEYLYVRRYRNFFADAQFRTLFDAFNHEIDAEHTFRLAPIATLVAGVDTQALDYNRYAEIHLGARAQVQGHLSLAFQPYYVWGSRWQKPTSLPHYDEFRFLVTLFTEI